MATRTRASAKAAGSRFEREIADYLAEHVSEFIDRRVKTGAKDRGDLAGIRTHGHRVVAELKNTARVSLGSWLGEAEVERGNDDALVGVVIHKRHGKGHPGAQLVTMTVDDFAALLVGCRPPVV
jgi:hypothetical protein